MLNGALAVIGGLKNLITRNKVKKKQRNKTILKSKMNLSFAGCGFLGIYHVGVAVCFKKYAPHLLLDKISGASAGALSACCLLCDMPLGEMTSDFFRVVNEARKHSLGPFSPNFNIQTSLMEGLEKFLPPDAHERVNGKLHISLTRVYDSKNVIVSHFNSRQDLLDALLCACFIPIFSGIVPPRFHGVRYMDGAFSDNLPTIDQNTITVSPFCGESDICPRDNSWQMFHVNWANTSIEVSKENMDRFTKILFPPPPETLSNLCQAGFADAMRYLHRNNLINCARCLMIQMSVNEATKPDQNKDEACNDCDIQRQQAKQGDLPESVLSVFHQYINNANKGIFNWLFRHRSARIMATVMTLPATIPADIMVATVSKLAKAAPVLSSLLSNLTRLILEQLHSFLTYTKDRVEQSGDIGYFRYDVEGGAKCRRRKIKGVRSYINMTDPRIYSERSIKKEKLQPPKKEMFNEIIEKPKSISPSFPELDTFEHFLAVTSMQEAVYAYYYIDADNKTNFTGVFDVSHVYDAPPPPTFHSSAPERAVVPDKLHYDYTDWNANISELSYLPESQSVIIQDERRLSYQQEQQDDDAIMIENDQPEADQTMQQNESWRRLSLDYKNMM